MPKTGPHQLLALYHETGAMMVDVYIVETDPKYRRRRAAPLTYPGPSHEVYHGCVDINSRRALDADVAAEYVRVVHTRDGRLRGGLDACKEGARQGTAA